MLRTSSFKTKRASLFISAGLFLIASPLGSSLATAEDALGQGDFRYEWVRDWGRSALESVKIRNGHGVIIDQRGRVVFLTDEPENNVIVLSPEGNLLEKWTARMPGAHGLTHVAKDGEERIFITDTVLHEVRKLKITGEEVLHLPWPKESDLYQSAAEYRPSKVLIAPHGDFFIFDGYGKDFVHHYSEDGKWMESWGGNRGEPDNQLEHFGPHGGVIDTRVPNHPVILICMSDRQRILRFTLNGKKVNQVDMPGGNPRDAVIWGDHLIVPHLSDNWPADRSAPGFISIMDKHDRIVSNVGGMQPVYDPDGKLQIMKSTGAPFIHPHAVAADSQGNLYVAQFSSPAAPLIKLQRLMK